MIIPVPEDKSGRLDKILSELLDVSRSFAAKLIKADNVRVNGEQALVKTLVQSGDSIEVNDSALKEEVRSTNAPELEILFENDDVLVVNKPAGLLVHHAPGNTEGTLADALLAYYPEIAPVGDDPERPGIVHRLDKFASGVLITAKHQAAFEHLKTQFKDRLTKKEYLVLVEGEMPDHTGTINFSIERSKSTGRMAAKPVEQGGKEAITHYEVMKAYPHHTLLRVQIETGRTHQIRVHMFSLDHPVAGDTLYRKKGKTPMDIGRLFLHAHKLTIELPGGETKTFESPLPKELHAVLESIPVL